MNEKDSLPETQIPFHTVTEADALTILQTTDSGLSDEECNGRQIIYGKNEFVEGKKEVPSESNY